MSYQKDKAFEDQLRTVRPVQPREGLERKIEASLSARGRQHRMQRFRVISGWGGLGIAATLFITFGILLFNGRLNIRSTGDSVAVEGVTPPPALEGVKASEADTFRPVLAENNLKSRIDEGVVFLRNGLTARRYRYEFVDRVVWRNPSDGAIMEMEIPRDEVVLIPVQTF